MANLIVATFDRLAADGQDMLDYSLVKALRVAGHPECNDRNRTANRLYDSGAKSACAAYVLKWKSLDVEGHTNDIDRFFQQQAALFFERCFEEILKVSEKK